MRAAGLQHVRIWSARKKAWPPYDGGSFALWQAVMPHVYKEGTLKPYTVPAHTSYALPEDPSRWVSYTGDGNESPDTHDGAHGIPRLVMIREP